MNLIKKYGVDAQGLIQRYGGIEKCREIIKKAPMDAECYSWVIGDSGFRYNTVYLDDLRTAIAEYDRNSTDNLSHLTDNFTHLENHISPNTKVIER